MLQRYDLAPVIRRARHANELDPFDIVEGLYWWLVEHHSGQSSWEYELQCQLGRYYRPGATCGPSPETYDALTVYQALCSANGCESGYVCCDCRDCMNDNVMACACRPYCDECLEAGCNARRECQGKHAYGAHCGDNDCCGEPETEGDSI